MGQAERVGWFHRVPGMGRGRHDLSPRRGEEAQELKSEIFMRVPKRDKRCTWGNKEGAESALRFVVLSVVNFHPG